MPWKAAGVAVLRDQFVHAVRQQGLSVSQACRQFEISRQTGHLWLKRFDQDPDQPLLDRSRRPVSSPAKTPDPIESLILDTRLRSRWGARKIHAYLSQRGHELPSVRTVHAVLARAGLLAPRAQPRHEPIRYQRAAPNELWQVDHKCAIEIQRVPRDAFTVLDDHSRYLLAFTLVPNRAVTSAWEVLWRLMGEVGLPDAILSDNAFSTCFSTPSTLSWFDANLIRLGIRPIHGRPYHPQTQGKVERLHGTLEREMLPFARRDRVEHFQRDADDFRRLYNSVRPHEAVLDRPPATRWAPSARRRPRAIPPVEYPQDAVLRKVSTVGDIRWKKRRILAGRGLVGQHVRVVETEHHLELYFASVRIRSLLYRDLKGPDML
jgi:transposase InsO family protein